MSSAQITTGQDSIVTEIEVAAPPERVFTALTDPQQLMRWWRGEDPRVGGRLRFETADPTRKIIVNGISDFKANGEILEYDPPRVVGLHLDCDLA
jgi:uncharacterized protein YndB with AHSA1/START domain